jgi:homoserine O-acetyltransferase
MQKIKFIDFQLKNGKKQAEIILSYQIFGPELGQAPVVLVNHALTGNSQVTGQNGWWNEIIGENKVIDTIKYTVIAFNIPGNGYQDEENLIDNYQDFTNFDIAKIFWQGLDELQVSQLFAIIGGSLGGAIAWEMYAQRLSQIDNLIPIATSWTSSDWLIGNVLVQDNILNHSTYPIQDARAHAMLLYRTPESLNQRFKNRKHNDNQFLIENWLQFHGNKLESRFSLKAYKIMNHLLKTTNVIKNQSVEALFSKTKTHFHLISVDSDYFFTANEIKQAHEKLIHQGTNSTYYEIKSIHGHDAFLIEFEQIQAFLKKLFQ